MIKETKLELQDNLNTSIWNLTDPDNIVIYPKIRLKLLKIAKNFFEALKLKISIEDVVITGSIAGYSWNENSDIDLHIILDFSKIDADIEITKDWILNRIARWNDTHNITLKGFPIEIYVQDINEKNITGGSYSLITNEWINVPSKEDVEYDDIKVNNQAQNWMTKIDELDQNLALDNSNENAEKIHLESDKIKEDLRQMRRKELVDDGIYSTGNLVFKKLRNSGYLEKLKELNIKSYDTMYTEELKPRD